MRLIHFAILLVGIIATQHRAEAADHHVRNPEVEVIGAYLRINSTPGIQNTILGRLTASGLDLHDLLTNHAPGIPDDLIKDFCNKNKRSYPAWPELRSRYGAVLISDNELNSIFGTRPLNEGWKRFAAKYPHGGGILSLSRVGFNRQRTKAMFLYALSGGPLVGISNIQVMEKRHGKWVRSLLTVTAPVFS